MASINHDAEATDCQHQQASQQYPNVVVYRFDDTMVYARGDPNYDVSSFNIVVEIRALQTDRHSSTIIITSGLRGRVPIEIIHLDEQTKCSQQAAIARVQEEFPELRSAQPTQIQLLFNDQYNGENYLIRGASDAWADVLSIQSERCVIDVKVLEGAVGKPPSYIRGVRARNESQKTTHVDMNVDSSGKGRRVRIKKWLAMLQWK